MKSSRRLAAFAVAAYFGAGGALALAQSGDAQRHALGELKSSGDCLAAAQARSALAASDAAQPAGTLHARYLYANAIEDYDACEKSYGALDVAYRTQLSLLRAQDRSALVALLHGDKIASGDSMALMHDDLVAVCAHYKALPQPLQAQAQAQVRAYDKGAPDYQLEADADVDAGCGVPSPKGANEKKRH